LVGHILTWTFLRDTELKTPWPSKEDKPISELSQGYFTKAFPWLFPDGKADFTQIRMGKNPTMEKWIQHLLKVDHRFAKDPIFIMVVTNVMQKKQVQAKLSQV